MNGEYPHMFDEPYEWHPDHESDIVIGAVPLDIKDIVVTDDEVVPF